MFSGAHASFFFRPDTLDPALLRPGRLDRKVEFGLPDLESRTQIFKIHTRTMNCERDIRFELLSRLCPNSTGKHSPFRSCFMVNPHDDYCKMLYVYRSYINNVTEVIFDVYVFMPYL